MTTDVSVIIAAYNIENYIERAIRSALDQQDVSVEVIVIDDCSTDKTFAVASSIKDERLTCLRLPQNGGPSIARNKGFAKASGTWIAVLDGDDAYAPHRLADCLKRAAETRADIVADNLYVIREADGERFTMFRPNDLPASGILNLADFIRGNTSFFGSYSLGYLKPVFKADFLRQAKIAYDPEIHIGEDYMLMCEALAQKAVCAIAPSAGYLYTARTGSISHRLAPQDLDRMAACDRKFMSRYTLSPEARLAQKERDFKIREAYAFTKLVDHIKHRRIAETLLTIISCPSAVRHLSGAIKVRINRIIPAKAGVKS